MFWVFVAASTLLALPGFWMQPGAGDLPAAGVAYAAHCAVLLLVAMLSSRRARRLPRYEGSGLSDANLHRLAVRATGLIFNITAIVIVVFGSYQVLLGRFDRGVFRASLGVLGPLFVIPVFYVGPGVLALLAFHYRSPEKRRRSTTAFMLVAILLCVVMGVSLGYKSSAVRLIIPFVVAMYWRRTRSRHIVGLGGFASIMAIGASYFLENRGGNSVNYVYNRATLISARTPTFLYNRFPDGLGLDTYLGTTRSAVSDDVVALLGGPDGGTAAYNQYDFSRMVTALEYGELQSIRDGAFNTTSTVFGDGVVALGSPGFIVFSALAGLLVGKNYAFVAHSLHNNQIARASVGLVFFNIALLKWLSSGSPTSVVHIIVVIGVVGTLRLLGVLQADLALSHNPVATSGRDLRAKAHAVR